MRDASAGLIALLANSNEFVMREVYTFILIDGTELMWVTSELPNTYAVASTEEQADLET